MQRWFFLILSLCLIGPLVARAEPHFDVVWDIDWSLVSPTNETRAGEDPRFIFRYRDQVYRLNDHALLVLKALHADPRIRVSFFSGGKEDRNRKLLAWVYEQVNQLRPGRPAVAPFRILSVAHLSTRIRTPRGEKFSVTFMKDLRSIAPDLSLRWTVLLDDIIRFAPDGQKGNVLWFEQVFEDHVRFDPNLKPGPFDPRNAQDWWLEKNRLVWAYEILSTALASARSSGTDFRAELNQLLENEKVAGRPQNLSEKAAQRIQAGFHRLGFLQTPRDRSSVGAPLCRDLMLAP